MALHASQEVLRLSLRDPFRIARSDHDAGHAVTTVILELRDDRFPGLVGIGEGYPDRFYGDTVETMAAVMPRLLDAVGEPQPTPAGIGAASARMAASIAHHGGAKCARDIALCDAGDPSMRADFDRVRTREASVQIALVPLHG